MKIGKNKFYGLNRWYISIDNQTKHYYCKYEFYRAVAKLVNQNKLRIDEVEKIYNAIKNIM